MTTKRTLLLMLVLTMCVSMGLSQKFRGGIFLHHSTGRNIWGPNGSSTSVPQEIPKYNTSHGYAGSDAVSLQEILWPATDDNEWERWHRIFENRDTVDADIRPIMAGNRIIIIKSCFPSSGMWGLWNSPSDTLRPADKTPFNYKWHWRSFIRVMKSHPENFFVVWTNAPLVNADSLSGIWSDRFCRWAKDTLARGLDPVFGAFPKNVYVFDFFHKLADSHGRLPRSLAVDSLDSHPNSAATQIVAPLLVQEVFDAAIAYEKQTGVERGTGTIPSEYSLSQNYPNPFNPTTTIEFRIPGAGPVTLKVYDLMGREISTLVDERLPAGLYNVTFTGTGFASGAYFCRMRAGDFSATRKLDLLK